MKRVLVTGGAGFIGSHLVEQLMVAGYRVTIADNFDSFYDPAVKHANLIGCAARGRFELVNIDVRDLGGLRRRLTGDYDAIVHLAALGGVRPSLENPVVYQDVNVGGTQNLLELAREWGVGQFVFASSSSVYGLNPNVPWREDDNALRPISPYASTKLSGELLGHVYSHLYGIRFIGLRLFTVYGPRQRPDLAIHKFARLILDGRPVLVYGDGATRRDYTFVDDIVAGILAAVNYNRSAYEVINLGNNRVVSLAEMVGGLEAALGLKAKIEYVAEQPGDVSQTWGDISKARALLGYAPSTEFPEGLRQFAEWLAATRGLLAGVPA